MKRFLIALAVGLVVAVTYVAAAPGSQEAGTPTARQFLALKKQVTRQGKQITALKKDEGQVKTLAMDEAAVIVDCLAYQAVPVTEYGDVNSNGTDGYAYTDTVGSSFFTTALDLTYPGDSVDAYLLAINPDASCVDSINGGFGLRHLAKLAGVRFHPARPRVTVRIAHH